MSFQIQIANTDINFPIELGETIAHAANRAGYKIDTHVRQIANLGFLIKGKIQRLPSELRHVDEKIGFFLPQYTFAESNLTIMLKTRPL